MLVYTPFIAFHCAWWLSYHLYDWLVCSPFISFQCLYVVRLQRFRKHWQRIQQQQQQQTPPPPQQQEQEQNEQPPQQQDTPADVRNDQVAYIFAVSIHSQTPNCIKILWHVLQLDAVCISPPGTSDLSMWALSYTLLSGMTELQSPSDLPMVQTEPGLLSCSG